MGFKLRHTIGHAFSILHLILAAGLLLPAVAVAQTNSSTGISWNNITTAIGSNSSGIIENLISSGGASTAVRFQMLSRFNGADENGTISSMAFPANATRDSLFGNIEPVNGLANITPSFKITFPRDIFSCSFTIYASRLGATHNLQTRYTLVGASTSFVDLNPANNIDHVVYLSGQPDASGSVTLTITPGPENNDPNHLTYLGAIRLATLSDYGGPNFYFDFGSETSLTSNLPFLMLTRQSGGSVILRLDADANSTPQIEFSTDLRNWEMFRYLSLTNGTGELEIQLPTSPRFFRAVQ
jgi:hypothetical protein